MTEAKKEGDDGGAAESDTAKIYKPEGMPEHFYGKTDTETIDKLFTAVEGFRKEQAKGQKGVPEKPDGYALELEEEIEKRFFKKGDDGKDPFFEKVKEIAHASKIPQSQFQTFVTELLKASGEMFPAADGEEQGPPMDVEFKNFGGLEKAKGVQDAALAQIDGLHKAGKIKDEEVAGELRMMAQYGVGLKTLQFILPMFGEKPIPSSPGREEAAPDITQADLDEMMRDPKYWRDKDPDIHKKVTDGYKKLYGQA